MQQLILGFSAWLARVDPGAHRRVKGLRLVTTYGLALALGGLRDVSAIVPGHPSLATIAAAMALWACVSEARASRPDSSRDLAVLCVAAAAGAACFALCSPLRALPTLRGYHLDGGEWILLSGAFLAGWLRGFGVLGAGIGSQIYIGQLTAFTARLTLHDLPEIGIALAVAVVAAVVPRLLGGPTEQPIAAVAPLAPRPSGTALSSEFVMGLQAVAAAAIVILLNCLFGLVEPVWAITACVYGVAATARGTVARLRRRILGTLVGVPLGLACLPIAAHAPLLIWTAVAFSLIVYTMALPDRYDIACGSFAFALIATLALSGDHSIEILVSRAWETVLGAALAMASAIFVFPLRPLPDTSAS